MKGKLCVIWSRNAFFEQEDLTDGNTRALLCAPKGKEQTPHHEVLQHFAPGDLS